MKYKNEILFYVVIAVCTTCWRDRKVDQYSISYIIQNLIQMIKVNLSKIILKSNYIMVESYCLKQRKKTESVPGSEKIIEMKRTNPKTKKVTIRKRISSICAECGAKKSRFIPN